MSLRDSAGIYYFQKKKYLPYNNFVPAELANPIVEKYLELAKQNEHKGDEQVPNTPAWYGEPMCEYLMVESLSKMEKITGLKLAPTYTYMRVYKPGDDLQWHQDRPSCEISVTVNLGQSSSYDWPIWYADPDDLTVRMPVRLYPGEAMIYRGCEVPHWREKFEPDSEDDWQVQVFMHYVDKHGPFNQFAYDQRRELYINPYSKEHEEYLTSGVDYVIREE